MLNALFRWYVFFPLVALIAAALVLVSIGSALLPAPQGPVSGQAQADGLLLAGGDLAHAEASPETVIYVPRDAAMQATGLRVAIRAEAGDVRPDESGARIALAPEAAAPLGSGPLQIELQVAPVPVTTASELAVGVVRGGAMEWVRQPIAGVEGVMSFAFPAAGAAPSAVSVRPIGTDAQYDYGIEIRSIRLRRAG